MSCSQRYNQEGQQEKTVGAERYLRIRPEAVVVNDVHGEDLPKRVMRGAIRDREALYTKRARITSLRLRRLVEKLFFGGLDSGLPAVRIPLEFSC